MALAALGLAIQMGLICGVIGGVIGAVVGLIRWLASGGSKRGSASDYAGWVKQVKTAKNKEDIKK